MQREALDGTTWCHDTTRSKVSCALLHRHVIACVCIIVNPSCKYFTKIQTHCFFPKPSCPEEPARACKCKCFLASTHGRQREQSVSVHASETEEARHRRDSPDRPGWDCEYLKENSRGETSSDSIGRWREGRRAIGRKI